MFALGVMSDKRNARRPPLGQVWLSDPAITGGVASVGASATCTAGSYSGTQSFTYQWTNDGSNIGGATSAAYTPVAGDATHALRRVTTPTDGGPSTTTAPVTVAGAADVALANFPSPVRLDTSVATQMTVKYKAPKYNVNHTKDAPSLATPTGYRIFIGATSGEQKPGGSYLTTVDKDSSTFQHTFTGLTTGTRYRVSIQTLNSLGPGDLSPEVFATAS